MSPMVLSLALFLAGLASAEPYVERLEHVTLPLDPDWYDDRLEEAAGRAPASATSVSLETLGADGRPVRLVDLLPKPRPIPDKGEVLAASGGVPSTFPGLADGFLEGKAVYLSQCHGLIWYESLDNFSTQRGNNYGTVEDYHNPEGANQFLARYLENAGADVFAAKERDHNRDWAIADNDDDGYTETGSGFSAHTRGYGDAAPYDYGENPFDAGTSRKFAADGGGVATWAPDVPADGWWHVYTAWQSGAERPSDAHYRITHPGGVVDRYVDQRVHGSNWRLLGEFWLPKGEDGLKVELIADSAQTGKTLIADVVRVGGGTGVVRRHNETTGRPRWEEGAILALQFGGAPDSVYDPYGDGDGSDPTSRSRWAAWESPSGEDAVYLSWHSNAATGTARGTTTYWAGTQCSIDAVDGSGDLAELVQEAMMDSIIERWDSGWQDRGVNTSCFSEVSPSNNGEMPSALVELAFHDNEEDSSYLKDPAFRLDMSRAMYQGIARWFADKDGTTAVFLPEPPVAVRVVHGAGGKLVARWSPGPSGGVLGDDAESYLVQTSPDGRSWDNGQEASGTELTLATKVGETVWVRVLGLNDGGRSFPSSVAGARRSPSGKAPILVVDAFDRLDAGLLEDIDVGGANDVVRRLEMRRTNAGEAAVPHGRAVAAAGWPFEATADEALEDLDLADYDLVVWAAGEESTQDEAISSDQQDLLEAFVTGGGALWVSGAELLWDLDSQGTSADQSFAEDVLGASLASDDAGSATATGEGVLDGIPMSFADGPYPVEFPDSLTSDRPVVARYSGGKVAGVLDQRVATFGFPFDALSDRDVQDAVAAALIAALLPGQDPPVGSGDPDDTGDPDNTDGTDVDDDDGGGLPDRFAPKGSCGCAHSGPSGGAMLLLGLLLVRRRGRGDVG